MKKSIVVLILAVVAVSFAAVLHSFEKMENPSRTLLVHEDSLYGGGWVPRYFPTDIREIHEQHNLDTNEVWLKFSLGVQPYNPALHGYAVVPHREALRNKVRLPSPSGWWFEEEALSNVEETQLLSGPCRPEGENFPTTKGFVLVQKGVVYWWCQHI